MEDGKFLDDLDRGDMDCRQETQHMEKGSHRPTDIGYGSRYVFEQMKSAGEFN